jgi:amino acid permease
MKLAGDSVVIGDDNAASQSAGDRYSTFVCSIFILNMVMGTGPLTLPYSFNEAGIILAIVFIAILMSISFMTTTFVVEGLAIANRLKAGSQDAPNRGVRQGNERELIERFEIGAIAEAVMPRCLSKLPYIVLCVYAYGVLSVYVISGTESLSKELGSFGEIDSYYIALTTFIVFVTPLCLLDFQKTRPLQVFIGAVRILAVLAMIVFMVKWMFHNGSESFERMTSQDIPL